MIETIISRIKTGMLKTKSNRSERVFWKKLI